MPRHKPPLSLKHFALATVSKSIGQATVSLRRKWSSFEKEECKLEAKTIGEKLFGELSATMVNEVCNFVIKDYLESREMVDLYYEEDRSPQGSPSQSQSKEQNSQEEGNPNDGCSEGDDSEEASESEESQQDEVEEQEEEPLEPGSQEGEVVEQESQQEESQDEEIPELEPHSQDQDEESQSDNEDMNQYAKYPRLSDLSRICLRLLFSSGHFTAVRLENVLWSDPPLRGALISELKINGHKIRSFQVYYNFAPVLTTEWIRPRGYGRPTRINHMVISKLCKHCPNVRELVAFIPDFYNVGYRLSRLQSLEKLDLMVDSKPQHQRLFFSQMNHLIRNCSSLKSVRLNIWGGYGSILNKWHDLDTPVSATMSYETNVQACEIGIVTKVFPNLNELSLQWTPTPKVFDGYDFGVKNPITDDIKVLSSLRLTRFKVNHFTEINQTLMDFLLTQAETLQSLHLERMKTIALDSVLALSSICPYLEELDLEFRAIDNQNNIGKPRNSTRRQYSTGKLFENLQMLGIGTSKACLETFVPKMLKALGYMPKCLKIRDPNYIHIGQEGVKPTIDTLLMKEVIGNKDVEILMVGLKIRATTIDLLVKECPSLRQLYHLDWDDEGPESSSEEDDRVDDTLYKQIEAEIKENNIDLLLETFFLY